jgi:hypothetical protein
MAFTSTWTPSTRVAGAAVSPASQIEILDGGGNRITSQSGSVVASLPSGTGTISGTTSDAIQSGLADHNDLRFNLVGAKTVRFTGPSGLTLTSNSFTIVHGSAASLVVTTQPSSSAVSETAFGTQPVVQLRDSQTNVVTGSSLTVTASVVSGGGTFTGNTAKAAVAGVATFTNLKLALVSSTKVRFSASGLSAVDSTITVSITVGASAKLMIVTQPSASVRADIPLAQQPVVRITDNAGNTRTSDGGSMLASQQTGDGALSGTTTQTISAGVATFAGLEFSVAPTTVTLQFTVGGFTLGSNSISVILGPFHHLIVTSANIASTASLGTITNQPVVAMRDDENNVVTTDNNTVLTATLNTGPGTLKGTLARTVAAGVATFTNLNVDLKGTGQVIRVHIGGFNVDTPAFTITHAAASKLNLDTAPSASTVSLVTLAPSPIVSIQDVSGNRIDTDNASTITVVLGTPGSAALGGTLTRGVTSGVATFTGLNINLLGSVYTLDFSAAVTGVSSTALTITHAIATKLAVTTNAPSTATNGIALGTNPIVMVQDASGNLVTSGGEEEAVITATLAPSVITAGNPNLLLGGTVTRTAAGGSVTFPGLTIRGTVGAYTISFTATALTTAASSATTLAFGAPTALYLQTEPSVSTESQVAFAQQPVVHVRDSGTNIVANDVSGITAAISTGNGVLSSTQSLIQTATAGVLTFSGLQLTLTGTDKVLAFTFDSLTSTTTAAFTITAGPATHITVTVQPAASTVSEVPFATQPTVTLYDTLDNIVLADSTSVVTAVLWTGAGALTPTAQPTVTFGSGVAVFSGLKVDLIAMDNVLRFTCFASSFTVDTAPVFIITHAVATKLALIAPFPATVTPQVAVLLNPQPTLQTQDAQGNVVTTGGSHLLVIAAVLQTGGGTLNATLTHTSVLGVALFTDLVITSTIGSKTLRFSSGLLTTVETSVSLALGPAALLTVENQPGAVSVASESVLNAQPIVAVRDAGNNLIDNGAHPDVAKAVTASIFAGVATLQGTAIVAAVTGIVTFTNLAITAAAGGYKLRFTAVGLQHAATGDITVTPPVVVGECLGGCPSGATCVWNPGWSCVCGGDTVMFGGNLCARPAPPGDVPNVDRPFGGTNATVPTGTGENVVFEVDSAEKELAVVYALPWMLLQNAVSTETTTVGVIHTYNVDTKEVVTRVIPALTTPIIASSVDTQGRFWLVAHPDNTRTPTPTGPELYRFDPVTQTDTVLTLLPKGLALNAVRAVNSFGNAIAVRTVNPTRMRAYDLETGDAIAMGSSQRRRLLALDFDGPECTDILHDDALVSPTTYDISPLPTNLDFGNPPAFFDMTYHADKSIPPFITYVANGFVSCAIVYTHAVNASMLSTAMNPGMIIRHGNYSLSFVLNEQRAPTVNAVIVLWRILPQNATSVGVIFLPPPIGEQPITPLPTDEGSVTILVGGDTKSTCDATPDPNALTTVLPPYIILEGTSLTATCDAGSTTPTLGTAVTSLCQVDGTLSVPVASFTCADINECLTNNGGCDALNAVCANGAGVAVCTCETGFTTSNAGVTCTASATICTDPSNPCGTGACTVVGGSYSCTPSTPAADVSLGAPVAFDNPVVLTAGSATDGFEPLAAVPVGCPATTAVRAAGGAMTGTLILQQTASVFRVRHVKADLSIADYSYSRSIFQDTAHTMVVDAQSGDVMVIVTSIDQGSNAVMRLFVASLPTVAWGRHQMPSVAAARIPMDAVFVIDHLFVGYPGDGATNPPAIGWVDFDGSITTGIYSLPTFTTATVSISMLHVDSTHIWIAGVSGVNGGQGVVRYVYGGTHDSVAAFPPTVTASQALHSLPVNQATPYCPPILKLRGAGTNAVVAVIPPKNEVVSVEITTGVATQIFPEGGGGGFFPPVTGFTVDTSGGIIIVTDTNGPATGGNTTVVRIPLSNTPIVSTAVTPVFAPVVVLANPAGTLAGPVTDPAGFMATVLVTGECTLPVVCGTNALCTLTGSGANNCTCAPAFAGDGLTCTQQTCAVNFGGCVAVGICTEAAGTNLVTCSCPPGYNATASGCAEINACATSNGGCSGAETCHNTVPNGASCTATSSPAQTDIDPSPTGGTISVGPISTGPGLNPVDTTTTAPVRPLIDVAIAAHTPPGGVLILVETPTTIVVRHVMPDGTTIDYPHATTSDGGKATTITLGAAPKVYVGGTTSLPLLVKAVVFEFAIPGAGYVTTHVLDPAPRNPAILPVSTTTDTDGVVWIAYPPTPTSTPAVVTAWDPSVVPTASRSVQLFVANGPDTSGTPRPTVVVVARPTGGVTVMALPGGALPYTGVGSPPVPTAGTWSGGNTAVQALCNVPTGAQVTAASIVVGQPVTFPDGTVSVLLRPPDCLVEISPAGVCTVRWTAPAGTTSGGLTADPFGGVAVSVKIDPSDVAIIRVPKLPATTTTTIPMPAGTFLDPIVSTVPATMPFIGIGPEPASLVPISYDVPECTVPTGGSPYSTCTRPVDGSNLNTCGANFETTDNGATCQCNIGYGFVTDSCVICAAGSYKDTIANTACIPCVIHATTLGAIGKTAKAECLCEEGWSGPAGPSECAFCAFGSYKVGTNVNPCLSCGPATTTNATAAVSQAQCQCQAGFFGNSALGFRCGACTLGTYSPAAGALTCTNAGADNIVVASASSATQSCDTKATTNGEFTATACVCKAGFAGPPGDVLGGGCTACATGYEKPAAGDGECTNINECTGTNNDCALTGATCTDTQGSFTCACNPGFTGDGVTCTACVADFFKDASGPAACSSCRAASDTQGATGSTSALNCLCDPGYLSAGTSAAGTCTACGAGKYKIGTNNNACVDCGAGTWSVTTGGTAASTCTACAAGTWSDTPGLATNSCISCIAGWIGTATGGSSIAVCSACPEGTASPTAGSTTCSTCVNETITGAVGATTCGSCGTLESPNAGQTACICDAGALKSTLTPYPCEACPLSTYKVLAGDAATCTPCSALATTVATGQSLATACTCPAGTFGTAVTGACQGCAKGEYSTGTDAVACTACTGLQTTLAKSAAAEAACVCSVGAGLSMGSCVTCPKGTYSGVEADLACDTCPTGADTFAVGRDAKDDCHCKAGFWGNAGTEFGSCTACTGNTYRVGLSNSAQSCISCISTAQIATGSNRESESDCVCKAAYTGVAAGVQGCILCEDGSFKSTAGDVACTACPGTSVTESLVATGKDEQSDCECPAGEDGTSGPMTCTACSVGKYKAASGNVACVDCPAGSTVDATGSTSVGMCQCNAGYIGTASSGSVCSICALGTYKAGLVNGVTQCSSCGLNTNTAATGTTLQSLCRCDAGFKGNPHEQAGSCAPCDPGTWRAAPGTGACASCATGSTTSPIGSTAIGNCRCDAGWGGDSSAGTACVQCPAGQFKLSPGNSACGNCAPNKFSVGTGNTACQACIATAESVSGSVACQCKAGYYGTGSTCTLCAKGQWSAAGSSSCTACVGESSVTTLAGSVSTGISACICAIGYGGSFANTCTACAIGTEKEADGDASCTMCNNNFYKSAATATACLACPSPTTNVGTGNAGCLCPAGFTGNGLTCTECGLGTFAPVGNAVCTPCTGSSSTSTATSETIAACACNAGSGIGDGTGSTSTAGGNGGTCTPCAAGHKKLDALSNTVH